MTAGMTGTAPPEKVHPRGGPWTPEWTLKIPSDQGWTDGPRSTLSARLVDGMSK